MSTQVSSKRGLFYNQALYVRNLNKVSCIWSKRVFLGGGGLFVCFEILRI